MLLGYDACQYLGPLSLGVGNLVLACDRTWVAGSGGLIRAMKRHAVEPDLPLKKVIIYVKCFICC